MTDDDRLADLLLAWDDAVERGEKPQVAEICQDAPELVEKLEALLKQLNRVSRALEDTVLCAAPAPRGGPLPRTLGRYQLTRLLGAGALGFVYGAQDMELPREVAVKLIQGSTEREDVRRRFAHEAAITSQLDHPGVVPVHGYDDGDSQTPYYAMRLIRGRSLDDEIAAFHAAEAEGCAADEVQREFRRLLRSFVTACQTIAFAHSRGILHRDIKPQNIMVGPYGETLVVDWGLARHVAAAAEEPSTDEDATRLAPLAGGEREQMTSGMGTPQYMSPDQLRGETTTRSDIFSLGATLWKLLTGQGRFKAKSEWELVRMVSEGHYEPPESVRPGTPPALSAICAKAMAADPADRYATVSNLVEDVEAWLADEPVQAAPDPWWVTLRRWTVRNLPYVTAAGGLLAAAALALGVIALLVRSHSQQLEANYELAHQATRENARVAIAGLKWDDFSQNPMRREILQRTTDYYRQALKLQGDSLDLRRELAQTTLCLGLTEHYLSLQTKVPAALLDAAEQYRALSAEHPDDLDLAYGRIASQHVVGMAYFDFDQVEATPYLTAAYEGLTQLDPKTIPDTGPLPVGRLIDRLFGAPAVVQADTVIYLAKLADRHPEAKLDVPQIRRWEAETRAKLAGLLAADASRIDLVPSLVALDLRAAAEAVRRGATDEEGQILTLAKNRFFGSKVASTLRNRLLEVQLRLATAEWLERTMHSGKAVAEVDAAIKRSAPILERIKDILAYEFVPPREVYEALRQATAILVRDTARQRAAGEPVAALRGRLQLPSALLAFLGQHFAKLAGGDTAFAPLVRAAAAEMEAAGMSAEAAAALALLERR